MTPKQTLHFGLLIVAIAAWLPAEMSTAQPAQRTRRVPPVHTARTSPDGTKPAARSSSPPTRDAAEADKTIPPPFTLPVASRTKVRACGEKWRDMKLAGTTLDEDWRDFALRCLVGKGSVTLAN